MNKFITQFETENTIFKSYGGLISITDKISNGKINIELNELIEFTSYNKQFMLTFQEKEYDENGNYIDISTNYHYFNTLKEAREFRDKEVIPNYPNRSYEHISQLIE